MDAFSEFTSACVNEFNRVKPSFDEASFARRVAAIEAFEKLGFPTTQLEEWKYTSCYNAIKSNPFHVALADDVAHSTTTKWPVEAYTQSFVNGACLNTIENDLFKNIPLIDAQEDITNGFEALTIAFAATGGRYLISSALEKPLVLLHTATHQHEMQSYEHVLKLEKNASATVIEYFTSDAVETLSSIRTNIEVGENATLTYYKIIQESPNASHYSNTVIHQQKNSKVNCMLVTLSGQWVRSDLSVFLKGKMAECKINGLSLVNKQHHVDNHINVLHESSHCISDTVFRSIATDKGRAVFNGRIKVFENASKTRAELDNKNIVLTDTAEIDTKPELEILTSDVSCRHGATVGEIDQEALFYLRARGISEADAYAMMLNAFASAVVDKLTDHTGNILKSMVLNQLHTFSHVKEHQ